MKLIEELKNTMVGGKERTTHPTQKPISICELFIKYWTNENDLVLDPFVGSGTTAVACKILGRNYIGCENNPEYFTIAKQRISNMLERLI